MPVKKINPSDFEEKDKDILKDIPEEEEDVTPKKITSDEGSDTDDAYFDSEDDDIPEEDSFDEEASF